MKKNMKIVAALISIGLVSPMAYATNGDEMMAVGSQSAALGGTGVANYIGAESTFANPGMLGKSKGSEVTGGIVLFKPSVTNTGIAGTVATSKADTNYIPDVSFSSRMSDSLSYGVAMAGIAGMGVDYVDAPSHIKAKTALSILRVIPTIAYNDKDYGVGFSPVLQYGSLMVSYDGTAMGGGPYNAGQKADTNTGYGYALGGYFDVMTSLTVAASYQSMIDMTYGKQLSGAGNGFGLCQPAGGGCTGAAPFGDKLAQPAVMKAGVAYTMSNITLTADYKSIQWSSATGYKDFNWKDQAVFAIGAKYAGNGFWVGAGYNQADDPIGELSTGSSVYRDAAVNFFNNLMFPGIVKTSMTLGGGYDISKALAVEASAVMTPEVKKTVAVGGLGGLPTNTTTHSQSAYSVSLRYKF